MNCFLLNRWLAWFAALPSRFASPHRFDVSLHRVALSLCLVASLSGFALQHPFAADSLGASPFFAAPLRPVASWLRVAGVPRNFALPRRAGSPVCIPVFLRDVAVQM